MYKKVLKYEITKEDLKNAEIAIFLDIDKSNFRKYANEIKIIPLKYLVKLCDHLEISLDYIFEYKNYNTFKEPLGKMNKKIIGNNLKIFRENIGISQEVLARIIKDKRTNISGYENGKILISTSFLYKLCQQYNISTDDILRGKNS